MSESSGTSELIARTGARIDAAMTATIDFKGSPRDVGGSSLAANSRKPAALVRRDAGAADRDQGQCAAVKGEHAATYHASRRHEKYITGIA